MKPRPPNTDCKDERGSLKVTLTLVRPGIEFPELLTLTIDDERTFFFTLTPASFLLLPGLEKLPTLGGDRI